jgi:hypothetical protein
MSLKMAELVFDIANQGFFTVFIAQHEKSPIFHH